ITRMPSSVPGMLHLLILRCRGVWLPLPPGEGETAREGIVVRQQTQAGCMDACGQPTGTDRPACDIIDVRPLGHTDRRQPPSPLAMRSMPPCAHAASLSPPGAPETPIEPTSSWPAMIGSAPSAEVILSRCSAPAPVGFAVTRLPNSPEGVRNVREVYALRRLFSRVCGLAPSSCNTTAVRPARFSTVTVTLSPSLP